MNLHIKKCFGEQEDLGNRSHRNVHVDTNYHKAVRVHSSAAIIVCLLLPCSPVNFRWEHWERWEATILPLTIGVWKASAAFGLRAVSAAWICSCKGQMPALKNAELHIDSSIRNWSTASEKLKCHFIGFRKAPSMAAKQAAARVPKKPLACTTGFEISVSFRGKRGKRRKSYFLYKKSSQRNCSQQAKVLILKFFGHESIQTPTVENASTKSSGKEGKHKIHKPRLRAFCKLSSKIPARFPVYFIIITGRSLVLFCLFKLEIPGRKFYMFLCQKE